MGTLGDELTPATKERLDENLPHHQHRDAGVVRGRPAGGEMNGRQMPSIPAHAFVASSAESDCDSRWVIKLGILSGKVI